MKRKKEEKIPEIEVPKGYDLFDLIDTDDGGYGFGEPVIAGEVKIRFERNEREE